MIGNYLGYFEKPPSYVKSALLLIGQLLENFGYFLLQYLVTLCRIFQELHHMMM